MTDQVGHNFAIDGIDEPDHVVLATSHEDRGRSVPFHEVQIFLWDVIDGLFQGEAIFNIPDSQDIVHAACDQPFATRVELAEFDCFRMTS